jgi:hypothetical protein
LQALVLNRNVIDENTFAGDAEPLKARRYGLELRSPRKRIARIEICVSRQRKEFCAAGFDAAAKGRTGVDRDLMTFRHQDARNRQHRIHVTCRGRGSDKNFHGIVPLIVERRRSAVR